MALQGRSARSSARFGLERRRLAMGPFVRLASLLVLVGLLASGCLFSRGQRYLDFSTRTPIGRSETLILGFLGGRDSWNDETVGVGQLARDLRALGLPGIHVETVENKKRALGVELVRNSFDRNGDGVLDAAESSAAIVIVYGQSFGGAAVVKFARQLDALGVPVLLTVQVDSVGLGDAVIPPNVRAAANLFQRSGMIIRGEPEIRSADPDRTTILGNFQFDYDDSDIDVSDLSWFKKIGRVAHAKMDRDPEVWHLVEQLILDALATSMDWKANRNSDARHNPGVGVPPILNVAPDRTPELQTTP